MCGHTIWPNQLDVTSQTRYKRGHVPADHPAAEQGRFGGALLRAGRERPPSREGLRRGQGGAQLRPRRPPRPRGLGAAGREHPADPGGGRRRSRRPCRLERGRDRDRGRLRARRRARGASALGQARHRRGGPGPHGGTAAAGAARRRPPGHGGAAPRPARLQARLPRALARSGVAARGARPRPAPALPRHGPLGRARGRDRAGGVLARGRPVQARRRSGVLRRYHGLVRDRRGGRRRPRVARADLRAVAPARAQRGGRDNDPQVVIALAGTREGVPVRSRVFPGNTPDVTTVRAIKADLREMRLGRVLFVGDAGLYSKADLDALAEGAGRYILATPIRRVREIRDEVLSHPGRYAEIDPQLRAEEIVLGQGERRRRYILCLNEEEADKQRRHRAELLELLGAELASLRTDHPKAACRLLASRRFGPYLSQDDDGRPYLDQAKVRRAEQLDGKFVLTTNDDTLSVADVALGYKGMWIIEGCFRKMKTTGLAVRPMFHWVPHRITAHVRLCVLALMIQRAAEIATGRPWRRLAGTLERLKAVRYTSEGRTIVQATTVDPELADVLGKLQITTPKPILAVG